MSAISMSQPKSETGAPWWKEPYAWLVFGGPLVVVVAAIYTAVIAMDNPDPLIDRNAQRQVDAAAATAQALDAAALAKLQPANQARNHAASPLIPKALPAEK